MHINWWYWGQVVVADRVEIIAAFWFLFSCVALNMPHPDIPWDRQALKQFVFGVMQSVAINRSPQIAAAQYSQVKTEASGTVTETKASSESPVAATLPAK